MGSISDFVDGITGKGAADAAERSAQLMAESATDAIVRADAGLALQTQQNQPYMEAGLRALPGLVEATQTPSDHYTAFKDDPTGYAFLSENPMFQAAVDYSSRRLEGAGAAAGKFNSGGMVDALMQNYFATGDQYWNNYLNRGETLETGNINRMGLPVQLGRQASAQQQQNIGQNVANVGNWRTGQGSALAAGEVGSANALGVGAQNMLNLGLLAYGAGFGAPGVPAAGAGGTTSMDGWDGSGYGYF